MRLSFGDRIMDGMFAPGMATQNPHKGHIGSFERPPFLQGFNGIMRTSGIISTLVGAQKRRKGKLIKPDQEDQNLFDQPHAVKRNGPYRVNLYPTPRME